MNKSRTSLQSLPGVLDAIPGTRLDDLASQANGDESVVRSTFVLPESLHRELKMHSASSGISLKDVVIDALRQYLDGVR